MTLGRESVTDKETDEEGKDEEKRLRFVLKTFTVFCADQVEGEAVEVKPTI